MKFNIFRYNQRRAITIGLDLKDLCILEWIQDFWPKMKKMIIDGKEYGWINYNSMILDIPIIEIDTNDGLYRRLKAMVKIGLLDHRGVKNEMGSFSYYRITEKIIELFDDAYPMGGTDKKPDGGRDEKSDGTDKKPDGGRDEKSDGADRKSGRVGMKSRNKDNPTNNHLSISSSFITLEEAKKIAEEEDLDKKIDIEFWWKLSKANHTQMAIKNPRSAMIVWAQDPKNHYAKNANSFLEKSKEIAFKENEIKNAMLGKSNSFDFDIYFLGNIELIEGQFRLKKEVPEKFLWVCEKFNLKN